MKRWFVILASLLTLLGCEKTVHLDGSTMGTTYNIKYVSIQKSPDYQLLHKEIERLLEEVNAQMSTYRPDSELSQFNKSQSLEPMEVSPQIVTVVQEAIRLNKLTFGALDVTIGPLVNLWGFGPEARREIEPSDDELVERLANVGIEHLSVTNTTLKKEIPNLYVDLSTIAKGWGVDVVADYIQSVGITNYMVEIGGEIRVSGTNKDDTPWRIAIEKPIVGTQSIQEIIEPKNIAMATSGNYRNYFEREGVRYSHIINPQTGRPIEHRVVSVTALAPSCMTADGLATGLMVLGEEKGLEIAEQHNIPALMIIKTDDGFKEVASSAFKPYLNQ